MHPLYEAWLRHLFDHPATEPAWHTALDVPSFAADDAAIAALIELTFLHSGRDLARYSDAQLGQGFWYLLSIAGSGHIWSLNRPVVPLARRLSAIAALTTLYRDCFAARCTRTLSHFDDQPCSPLNGVCYMLWDISALTNIQDEANAPVIVDTCFAVLATLLAMDHPACQEAAIHGYYEFHYSQPARVVAAMRAFLKNPATDPRLHHFAARVRDGHPA